MVKIEAVYDSKKDGVMVNSTMGEGTGETVTKELCYGVLNVLKQMSEQADVTIGTVRQLFNDMFEQIYLSECVNDFVKDVSLSH